MSQGVYDEAIAAYNAGYNCAMRQKACAAGRIPTDPVQTIAAGATSTLVIVTTLFDDETPMISGNNILLANQAKIYGASITVYGTQATHSTGVITLNLMWYDGTTAKTLMSTDHVFLDSRTTLNCSLASSVKTLIEHNDNYIYATLTNSTDADFDVTKFRISAIRAN
jgi:hypothetical protein